MEICKQCTTITVECKGVVTIMAIVKSQNNIVIIQNNDTTILVYIIYLLRDVPQISVIAQSQQAVFDGDFVELSSLLVAEERVRDPDFVPARVAESDLLQPTVERPEVKARIVPSLAQVHADRVVLMDKRCDYIS